LIKVANTISLYLSLITTPLVSRAKDLNIISHDTIDLKVKKIMKVLMKFCPFLIYITRNLTPLGLIHKIVKVIRSPLLSSEGIYFNENIDITNFLMIYKSIIGRKLNVKTHDNELFKIVSS